MRWSLPTTQTYSNHSLSFEIVEEVRHWHGCQTGWWLQLGVVRRELWCYNWNNATNCEAVSTLHCYSPNTTVVEWSMQALSILSVRKFVTFQFGDRRWVRVRPQIQRRAVEWEAQHLQAIGDASSYVIVCVRWQRYVYILALLYTYVSIGCSCWYSGT